MPSRYQLTEHDGVVGLVAPARFTGNTDREFCMEAVVIRVR
jgi:hypothetical protein